MLKSCIPALLSAMCVDKDSIVTDTHNKQDVVSVACKYQCKWQLVQQITLLALQSHCAVLAYSDSSF